MRSSIPPAVLGDELRAVEENDDTTARVLDAALAEVTEFGIRRTTVDSVAQRAGLARMTVYRRFAGKDPLVQAVVVREVRRFLVSLAGSLITTTTGAEGLERGFVAGLLGWYSHPFCLRLLRSEPETVLPYLTREAAPTLAVVKSFIRAQLAHVSDVDRITPDSLDAACEAVTRLAQSFALTPPGERLPTEAELRVTARRMILPLLAAR